MANYRAYGNDMEGVDANLHQADGVLGVTFSSSAATADDAVSPGKPISRVGMIGLNEGVHAAGTAKWVIDVDEVKAAIEAVGGKLQRNAADTQAEDTTLDLIPLTGDMVVAAGWLFPQGGAAAAAGTATVGTGTDDDRFVSATALNVRRQPVAFTASATGVPNVIVAAGDTLRVKLGGTVANLAGAKFVVAAHVVDMSDDDSFATGAV